jgi:hypothetical protein
MYELYACINDDVELYGLKAKSNQFKTLRRRIARQVDDSILDELDDVDEVVDDVEVEEVNVVNDDANVNIVSAKVVAITKAKLKNIVKVVDPVDEIDPVVEIVHEKTRGRPTLAEAALKLDKLQEIEKLKPVVVRRTLNRNSKSYDCIIILIFYILNLKRTSQLNENNKKFFIYLLKSFSVCFPRKLGLFSIKIKFDRFDLIVKIFWSGKTVF